MAHMREEQDLNQLDQSKETEGKLKVEELRKAVRNQLFREHFHDHCPKCGISLEALKFQGVPLDRCPVCQGIWLGPEDFRRLALQGRVWFNRFFDSFNS